MGKSVGGFRVWALMGSVVLKTVGFTLSAVFFDGYLVLYNGFESFGTLDKTVYAIVKYLAEFIVVIDYCRRKEQKYFRNVNERICV